MQVYEPDRWVVIEFGGPSMETPLRKVFAGWYGGYTQGDSWKLNSGVTVATKNGDWFEFTGYSGSVYKCHKNNYGMSGYMSSILNGWQNKALEEGGKVTIRILDIDEVVES